MTEREAATDVTGADNEWIRTRLFMRRPWLDDLPGPAALPAGYTLRAYEPKDLPALARLLTRAFEDLWDEERVRHVLIDAPDVEGAVQVHVQYLRPLVLAHCQGRRGARDAGVGDGHVRSAVLALYGGDQATHRGAVAHIAPDVDDGL